jgi:hypothetical protein
MALIATAPTSRTTGSGGAPALDASVETVVEESFDVPLDKADDLYD